MASAKFEAVPFFYVVLLTDLMTRLHSWQVFVFLPGECLFSFILLSNIKSNIFPTALEIYVKFELPLKLWVRTPTKLSEAAEMSQGNQFPWEPLYWFCSHYLIVFGEMEKWSSSVVWFRFLEPVCKSHLF